MLNPQQPSNSPIPLLSGEQHIAWPSFPKPHAAMLLSLLYQLEQSQWWSPEELLKHQMIQLQALLRHAYATVPFYKKILDELSFDLSQPLTYDRWSQLPLLTRDQIQSAGVLLRSNNVPLAHGQTSPKQTSGSTGQPLTVYSTELNGVLWQAFTLRDHHWHRRDCRGKLAVIRFGSPKTGIGDAPDGLSMSSWGPPLSLLYPTGPAATLNIRSDIQQQAQWLQQQNPDYLLTYPSSLKALLEHCQAQNLQLPKFETGTNHQ